MKRKPFFEWVNESNNSLIIASAILGGIFTGTTILGVLVVIFGKGVILLIGPVLLAGVGIAYWKSGGEK